MASQDIHVMMLPFPAFGHMMPFFQFSVSLARAGVHVSYVSTPRNILRLPKPPSDVVHLLKMVEIPLPTLEQNLLPHDAEATIDLPFEKIQYLKLSFDRIQHPFKQLIAKGSPDWLIIDPLPCWAIDVARECNVPVITLTVFSASSNSFFAHPEFLVGDSMRKARPSGECLTCPPHWVDFPSSVAFRGFEAVPTYMGFFGENNATGLSDAHRLAKSFSECHAIAIRSCKEFEGEYFDLYQRINKRPVLPVGLFPPEKPSRGEKSATCSNDSSWSEIFEWLSKQKPKSVVFVGFGSECKLSKEQVHEIAKGLELSELPFLWALRKPDWATDEEKGLPPSFLDRTSSFGLVCFGWVPQMDILAHPSVGGSLFHSGWGSIIETLQFGHALVVLPLIIDQPLNARFLVEKGLAVEVERREDGSFSGEGIAKALKHAMVSEDGENLRITAREAANVLGNQRLHHDYIGKFVEYLKQNVVNEQN